MLRDTTPHLHIRKRLIVVFCIMLLLMTVLVLRLGYIQFVRAEELTEKAWEQWNRTITARSSRGNIYDRHGRLLAGSATVETVVALPPQIEDPLFTARALSPVLDISEERIFEMITQQRAAVYLKRKVEEDITREVRLLNLPGITFTQETKRFYPNGTLLSQLIGFVGMDQGWGGLEIYFEEELKGQDGHIVFPTDNLGRAIPGAHRFAPPREGHDLYLTIDETIQFIVERELSRAMLEYRPARATALAVNPQTGEVLAAASKPDFDPNHYNEYDKELWRLFPVTDTYEPGSTFKLITLAAAMEENLYREDEGFFCPGYATISGHSIGCWTSDRGGHGPIDFLEAVLSSCNPAFMTLGERLGAQKIFNYIRAFGFGSKTGLEYPGEGAGLLFSPAQIGPLELATTSFGQGISVTPLQQVMAVSAIANGGYLLRPYLVKEMREFDGQIVREDSTEIVRQVISQDTANRAAGIMELVVHEGSGVNAAVEGYRIAGKTGTAQKVGPGGVYIPGEYILSFIGFAPLDDPQVLVYVAVDGATRGPQWGSQVSAPLFKAMIKDILAYLEIPPHKPEDEEEVRLAEVPPLQGLTVDEAGALLDTEGLIMKLVGSEGIIAEQTPKAGAEVPLQTSIIVYLEDLWNEDEPGMITMPDLLGRTIREAGEILGQLGLKMEPSGSGIAVQQEPPPGIAVPKEQAVKVYFSSPVE